jgi:hypothetical protein
MGWAFPDLHESNDHGATGQTKQASVRREQKTAGQSEPIAAVQSNPAPVFHYSAHYRFDSLQLWA